MLTKLERERILHREDLTVPERKNLNFRIRKKLIELKQNLEDINLILTYLPQEELQEILAYDHLYKALDITDSLARIIDPWPVGEHENSGQYAFKTYGTAFPDCEPGKCGIQTVSRLALEEDEKMYQRLKDHLTRLQHCIDTCVPDPICRDPRYAKELYEKLVLTTTNAEFSNYLDEYLVEGSSWIHHKPSVVDIEQLGRMRWKPRGLKECTEPSILPLLAPKTFKTVQEIAHARIESNAEGTHFLVSEKGGEKRAVSREDGLEFMRKHGLVEKGEPK
jgi:hypothetical protein